ncbi:putative non-specific serine/threonine protein kinase [Arabidopsis thaliana]
MDTVQFSPGGEIISIRLARSELGRYNRKELLRQLNDDSVLFGSNANERNMIITARPGHESNIRKKCDICYSIRFNRILDFVICFDSKVSGYPKFRISGFFCDICGYPL